MSIEREVIRSKQPVQEKEGWGEESSTSSIVPPRVPEEVPGKQPRVLILQLLLMRDDGASHL